MAGQTFKRGFVIPQWPNVVSSAPSVSTLTTDAADEVAAIICRAPKTGNVRAIWSSMQVGTGADRNIGLYTVDLATGAPTSPPTAFNTNSFATKSLVVGDSNDLVSSGSFGTDCPVVKGDLLSVCWIAPAASFGNILINTFADHTPDFPYRALFTGTWAKSPGVGILYFEYDDGTYEVPMGCIGAGDASGNIFTVVTFNNGSTPDVIGGRFQFPGPVRVTSCWLWIDLDGGGKVYLIDAAWDGTSGDALAQATLDPDVRSGTAANIHEVEFDVAVDFAAGTNFRVVVEPDSGTSLSLHYRPLVNAGQLAAQPLGANFHYTSAKDPNDDTDWTNYNNVTDGFRVPFMGVIVDQIDDGVGGGGGGLIVHPGMNGRLV